MNLTLDQLRIKYPALTFNNVGYDKLPPSVMDEHKEAIAEIEKILKSKIRGFIRFQNFKPRSDGSFAVRYQVCYNDECSFIGVAYTSIETLTHWIAE